MSALSDYLEARLMSLVFKNNALAFASPGDQLWVAAFTGGADLEAGLLTDEVTGGAYARVQVPASGWDHVGGIVTNVAAVDFPVATVAWGSITHGAILDTGTLATGNILWYGALQVSRNVAIGDQLRFLAGEIEATLG